MSDGPEYIAACPHCGNKPHTPAERAVLDAAVAYGKEEFENDEKFSLHGWRENKNKGDGLKSILLNVAEALARERRGGE